MADEQHEWLDKEAAEKMLRREPVDPSDGPPRNEAERLAAALDAVARTARPAAGELPGEAAALAAFRAVRRTTARTAAFGSPAARAVGADDSAESGMLAPVHIRPAGSGTASGAAGFRGPRPMRWSRPIRFGLVASLACCAIGGVAVAAGTGVLPGPFSRHAPTPATSVSAAASPRELGSDLTTDDGTSPPPGSPGGESAPPDTTRTGGPASGRPDGSDRAPAPTREKDGGDGGGDSRSGGAGDHQSAGTGTTSSPGGQDGDGTSGDSGDEASWYAKTLKACRDYRDGKLDDERRRRLEALAKGARNLDRFCDRMLDQADGKNDDGAGQGDRGDDEPAGSDGSSGGSGTLPSIGFSTVSPEPSATAESTASGSSRSPSPSLAAR